MRKHVICNWSPWWSTQNCDGQWTEFGDSIKFGDSDFGHFIKFWGKLVALPKRFSIGRMDEGQGWRKSTPYNVFLQLRGELRDSSVSYSTNRDGCYLLPKYE